MPSWRMPPSESSAELLEATDAFIAWLATHDLPVTLFLIAEQLDCDAFRAKIEGIRDRVTIGCHGWSHRCWSAWPVDVAGFSEMLNAARDRISTFAGSSWVPWYRAPGGYIAPWMAGPLAAAGFRLDSSVNPSAWVARKAGPARDWAKVDAAMARSGLVERAWATSWFGPACGPALSLFPFSLFAPRIWRRATRGLPVTKADVEDPNVTVIALYWHLLDHGRKNGAWRPPVAEV